MEGASRSPGRERCAGMSAAQKRKREGGDDGELVGAAPATKKVMNQGDAGTCVAYAFTLALSQGVDAKYGIAFDPAILVEKVKICAHVGRGIKQSGCQRSGTKSMLTWVPLSKMSTSGTA